MMIKNQLIRDRISVSLQSADLSFSFVQSVVALPGFMDACRRLQ